MPYNQKQTSPEEWRAIEAREKFCKTVNSLLMTDPKKPLKKVLDTAKTIVDTAFKYYPVPKPQEEQAKITQPTIQLEFPQKNKPKPKKNEKQNT